MTRRTDKPNTLRRVLSGLVAPKAAQEIAEGQHQVRVMGATPIEQCHERSGMTTTVTGVLKSVSLRPRANVPALEADLYDGSDHLTIVFLGRRAIAGIEPGRQIVATGRVNCSGDKPMMYNPRYQLRPFPSAG